MNQFKVVCVDTAKWHHLKVGEIYIVTNTLEHKGCGCVSYNILGLSGGDCCIHNNEIKGNHSLISSLLFRPVQDIGDQVETHIQELIKKEDLQTISV